MDIEQQIDLITSRLQEVMGQSEDLNLVKLALEDTLKIYWGTAPTGKIHIGYLICLLKIADFLKAECEVTILFADLHAMLDNLKSTEELVNFRLEYYQEMIKSILVNLNVPLEKLKFIKGSEFQRTPEYQMDLLRLTTQVSIHDAKKAGSEVVKQSENPKLSGLIYPLMQALDQEYLKIDIQFGGVDQRKIMTLSNNILPLIGYKKRIYLMNPIIGALNAKPSNDDEPESSIKMSSSDPNSKIDILNTNKETIKKINSMYSLEGDITFNPLLDLYKMIIFPLNDHLKNNSLLVNRPEKFGGNIEFGSYQELYDAFIAKQIHPQDLKQTAGKILNDFFRPIREKFGKGNLAKLVKKAYPE